MRAPSPTQRFDRTADGAIRRVRMLARSMEAGEKAHGADASATTPRLTDASVAMAMALAAADLRDTDQAVIGAALAMVEGIGAELFDADRQIKAIALAAIANVLLGRTSVVLVANPRPILDMLDRARRVLRFSIDAEDSTSALDLSGADIVISDARRFATAHLGDRNAQGSRHGPASRRAILLQDLDLVLLEETRPVTLHQTDRSESLRQDIESAIALARELIAAEDFHETSDGRMLTPKGAQILAQAGSRLKGMMRVGAYRDDMVLAALSALHDLQLGHDYTIADDRAVLPAAPAIPLPDAFARIGIQPFLDLKHDLPYSGAIRIAASASLPTILTSLGTVAGVSATLRRATDELWQHYRIAISGLPDVHAPSRLPRPVLSRNRSEANRRIVETVLSEYRQGRIVVLVVLRPQIGDPIVGALTEAGIDCQTVAAATPKDGAFRLDTDASAVLVVDKIGTFREPLALEGCRISIVLTEAFAGSGLERQICDHLVARQSLAAVFRFSSLQDPLFGNAGPLESLWLRLAAVFWPLANALGAGRRLLRQAGQHELDSGRRARAIRRAGERRFETLLSFTPLFRDFGAGPRSVQ